MKKLTCVALFFGILFFASAQDNNLELISEKARINIEKQIVSASQAMNTLQCHFTQEKSSTLFADKAVSKGILSYRKPESLRWEYTDEPNKFALVLNEHGAHILNDAGIVDNYNKIFKPLAELIVGTINGKGLLDSKTFKVEYYQIDSKQNIILVKMIPVQKRLKEVYTSVEIIIDKTDYLALEIIMNEASGDVTTISLSDKKINIELPQTLFSVN
ncbi:MAG: outer membrane lipoprotein carrier protein LolA [Bacteroidales bacterium]|jgi:outer membrane lipoprotein-sorting protein|nr:outer membrane lipoprotein carrier protein LolA [Bacteroidales bacterium]